MPSIKAIDSELFKLTARLRDVRQTAEDSAAQLADTPDDSDLQAELAQLEASEAAIQQQMARLERAKAGMERRQVEDDAEARVSGMRADVKRIDQLGAELEAISEDICTALESIGPLLQRFECVAAERGPLAYRVLREGETKLGAINQTWNRYRAAATLKEGPISLAMISVMWRLGLGRVGPQIPTDVLRLAGPNSLGAFTEHSDTREVMRMLFDRNRGLLKAGLDLAVATVESEIAEAKA